MLTPESALRKDRTTHATLQHRHFAEIARIIALLGGEDLTPQNVASHFADELANSNPRFDRTRFMRACGCN